MLLVQYKTLTFTINVDTFTSTLRSLVTNFKGCDIVLGINWLHHNKQHIDWATFILIARQEGFRHKTYPEIMDQLIKDHIFMWITEALDNQEDLDRIDFRT